MLYPGEELTEAAGYPALVRFRIRGDEGLPVVVFVTGGGVLGRIAYGPPEGRAADFLCHWLHEDGFPSLVLSYPVDSGGCVRHRIPAIFDHGLGGAERRDHRPLHGPQWPAGQRHRARLEHGGAHLRSRFMPRLRDRKEKGNELFVAMAAASALPHTLPGLDHLKPAASGLAAIRGAYLDWLLRLPRGSERGGRTTWCSMPTCIHT